MTAAVSVQIGRKPGEGTERAASGVAHAGIGPEGPELPLDAGEQYRFGFDMGACIGCHSCEVACAEQNGLPAGTTWRRVGEVEGGEHPHTQRWNLSMSCNHCVEPACLEGCPTEAYVKLDNGVVEHHADDCIGCQYCTWNCPYSVPVFQPDRRIVTKCDMCQPRLAEGLAPACVGACPTHAITVEKVNVAEWRADPSAGDAPGLPSVAITLSTTRISVPEGVPTHTEAASDWNLRPEHPHWPLVWLTLVSQIAAGVSATASGFAELVVAAGLAGASLLGALFHLGRPGMAWKAFRNLRRSWLSREVLLFSIYAVLAAAAVAVPVVAVPAAVAGGLGVYASARLYIVPGRPAWHSSLTIVRFFATAAAIGPLLTGHPTWAVLGLVVSIGATVANWLRLLRDGRRAAVGAVRLETRWFRGATLARFALTGIAVLMLIAGGPLDAGTVAVAAVAAVAAETIGRWLFYVAVVPLNMPGAFWRGAAGSHR